MSVQNYVRVFTLYEVSRILIGRFWDKSVRYVRVNVADKHVITSGETARRNIRRAAISGRLCEQNRTSDN